MNKIELDMIIKAKNHLQRLCGVTCSVFNIGRKLYLPGTECFCEQCDRPCDFRNTHLYGCYEAQRWSNRYIYYCNCGYIFIAVTILDNSGSIEYGLIIGPIIMGCDAEKDDSFIPHLTTEKVNDLCETAAAMFSTTFNLIHQNDGFQAESTLNEICKIIETEAVPRSYPYELEKQLQAAIIEGNSILSNQLMNTLLGYIFIDSKASLEVVKSRVLELIVLLSRCAIECGANIEEIFSLNRNYLAQLESFNSLECISKWLSKILRRFSSYVFEFKQIKHIDMIYKITAFLNDNYMKKITLDDIAEHIFMNKSYISKLFKDEMKCTLTTYLNNIRISKSKLLLSGTQMPLVDIANQIGFTDQSYFTTVFKAATGLSPKKYREKNGRPA